jgi:hypothetical protein
VPATSFPKRVTIQKYSRRHWAVYIDSTLLVVTVYKKGAVAVMHALENPVTSFDQPHEIKLSDH